VLVYRFRVRDSSVAVENTWEVIEEVQFARLNKLHFEVEEPVDMYVIFSLSYILRYI
jgi:translation initiation factor 3 subunit D